MLVLLLVSSLRAEDATDGEKLFALKIKPLLAEKCLACHGNDPDEIKGGLDLRSRQSLLSGGDSFGEEVLIPGNGQHSYLYITAWRAEEGFEMPPKQADQLSQVQQRWIRDWIDAEAPWPDDERVKAIQQQYAQGVQVATSKALSEDWQHRRYEPQKLWAYRPLHVTDVPNGKHPVDWFIDQQLLAAQIEPAKPADGEKLARRICFNFTGLPPEPEQIENFVAAYTAQPEAAVRELAKQLMATPHYGEHFGQHWLDVVRYADSAGFANDYSRPNAWRYRDYVVRAFTSDKPYNDFVREQIAGDEIDADDPELLIATGFLRMGPWEQTGMSVFKETRQQWLDDITDSVGQTFLGHALQCAKCHDHKFDPVPTRDYYRMMAVFSTTQFAERDAPFLEQENQFGFGNADAWVNAKLEAYEQQRQVLQAHIEARQKQETGTAKVGDNGLDPGDEASMARINKNMKRHEIEMDRTRPLALSVYTGTTTPRKNVEGRLPLPNNPWIKSELEADTIFTGGSVYAAGETVTPGALSALESLSGWAPSEFPGERGSRRLALAQWIVHPMNPLTARVIVNRVWSWHFGTGIAANPNNFGGTGGLPTHPELLDYLAAWFVNNGWSVKKLNELIVTSAAYRRSSNHPDPLQLAERDPTGQLYASFLPRRLTAEELRDAMLAASGELNRQVGGSPARPDINMEVAFQPRQIMGGTASVYEPDPLPEQRNRRSLYAEKIRGLRDPFLESFNQPGPDKSCELRETSTVAPQALTLFNAEEIHDRALAFAVRLLQEERDARTTIDRAFQIAVGRNANDDELSECLRHWASATNEETSKTYEPKTYPHKIDRTVMAEKTGEPYSFIEILPAFVTYQADIQPAEVDAKTRGLAQVCLVLFNLNEFSYLD